MKRCCFGHWQPLSWGAVIMMGTTLYNEREMRRCKLMSRQTRIQPLTSTNHWTPEADDFIDQLLITRAEDETVSSSPDPLPDTSDPSNTCKGIQSTLRQKCSTNCVQSTSQTTVCTTDICSTDSDRIPPPPPPPPQPDNHYARICKCTSSE